MTFDAVTLAGNGTIACGAHTAVVTAQCASVGALSLTGDDLTVAGGHFASLTGSRLTLTGGTLDAATLAGNAALVQNGGSITSLTLTGKTVSVELLGGSVGKMQVQNITDRFCLTLGGGSLASFVVQNCNRAELVVLPAADAGLAARIAPAFSVTSSRAVAFVRDGGSGNGSAGS